MTVKLRKLEDQTIVLTGATSGIGLVTARTAATRGAKLVLAARNEGSLRKLCDEIREKNGEAVYVVADVGVEGDVTKIAAEALNQFGNFDTWINNAGTSIYGKLENVSIEDSRRLFETNFWGTVYGSLVAARNLKMYGGALINIGSALSDVSIPIQGMYCASKHAVKGFTDALRMELEAEGAPISVTLIKPSAIDTPYTEHAKNYLDVDPQAPPRLYAPETVAETILYCCENPVRDTFIGAAGKILSVMGEYAPGFTDKLMENTMIDGQQTDRPAYTHNFESLYEPGDSRLKERGDHHDGHVAERSLYTTASLHPTITGAVATGAALAFSAGLAYSIMRRNQTH